MLYRLGQVVRHKRYGYFGVIVAADDECKASDAWYQANQTRPEREQPWYHVLVSGTHESTYPAESSLIPDESCQEVDHPLLPIFFHPFLNGKYERNTKAWPSNDLM